MRRRLMAVLPVLLLCLIWVFSSSGTGYLPVLNGDGSDSPFSIHFIDVGQADSALVQCEGHYMLIDGGNRDDSSLVWSVLERNRIDQLDILVGTHAHEDHIGGLPGALNRTSAQVTLCPVTDYDSKVFRDFASLAETRGGGITVPEAGDVYYLGSALVKVLGLNVGDDTNDSSIVLKIEYGQTSFLFTGDAERLAEQAILDSDLASELNCDLLKVGHHGSDSSTSYPFLLAVDPELAVISVGEGNSYGHPHAEVLSRLRDAGVTTYRTDMQGDILCYSDGAEITVRPSRNAGADTLSGAGDGQVRDYVLNTASRRFHLPDCSGLEGMSQNNRRDFTGTRKELIDLGYRPCSICEP